MADAALRILINAVDNASQTIAGVGNRLRGFGQSAGLIGGMLTAGVTLPLVGIAKQAVQTAGDFEAQMNVLTMAARSSGTSLEDLSQAALLVGADTQLVGINSAEAADAMTNFYKAGMTTADVFGGELNQYLQDGTNLTGALRSAIDLAAASELDLSQASMLVATSMATFGLEATDTARIADSFVGSADASTASVADLYQAMQNIGPTAAAFGFSLEETNTALAILSTRGIAGAEAGTALKSMFTNMMRGTADSVAALDELNIELYDSAGNMHSMENIIGQLSKSMAGMTEEQRNSYVQTLAGTYGMKAMNTLLAEGVTGWDAMEVAIADAATAQEVGAARTRGLNAAWEQLKGALETVYIQVGLPLVQNFLTPLVQKVTEVISGILKLNPQVLESAVAFAAVLAAIGPVTLAIGAISTALGVLLSPIGLVVAAVAGLALAWKTDFLGIATVIGHVSTIFDNWYTATGSVVDATLGALRGLGLMVPALQPVIQAVDEVVGKFREQLPGALATLTGAWQTTWPLLQEVAQTAWQLIQDTIQGKINVILPIVGAFATGAVSTFQGLWPTIASVVSTVFTGVLDTITTVTAFTQPIMANFVQAAVGLFQASWPIIGATVTSVLHAVRDVVLSVLSIVRGIIEEHGEAIQVSFQVAFSRIREIVVDVLGVVRSVITSVLTAVQVFIKNHGEEIKTFFGQAWEQIGRIVNLALQLIQETIIPMLQAIAKFIQAHGKEIQTILDGAWTLIKTVIKTVLGVIEGLIRTVLAVVRGDWKKAWEEIKKVAEILWEGIKTLIKTALNIILTLVGTSLAEVKQVFVTKWNEITGFLRSIDLASIGRAMMQGLINGILSMAGSLVDAARGVVNGAIQGARNLLDMHSPSRVFEEIGINVMIGFIEGIDAEKVAAAKTIAEAISSIIQAAVQAADALREFQPVDGLGIITAQIEDFLIGVEAQFADLIARTDERLAAKAQQFAESAGAVVALLVAGVDALRSLQTLERFDPSETIEGLAWAISMMVGNIDRWGTQFSGEVLTAAQEFAEAAGPVVDILSAAVDTLSDLQTLKRFDPSEAIGRVAWAISMMVGNFVKWGAQFSGEVLDAARAFAAGAGAVVDTLAQGMTTLRAMEDLPRFDPSEAIGRIAWAISLMIGNFDKWGQQFSTEALDAARAFAAGAGAVVGVVADGIQAISALAEWEILAPSIPDVLAKLTALRDWLRFIVLYLADATRYVSEEALAAARAFAESAGPVVGLVGNALKAIGELAEWETIVPSIPDVLPKLTALRDWLRFIVLYLADATRYVSDDAQTAARTFAEAAGPVVGLVGNALKAIGELAAWETLTPVIPDVLAKLTALRDWLRFIVLYIADATHYVSTEAQAAARAFAESAGPVVGLVGNALKAISELAKWEAVALVIPDVLSKLAALRDWLRFIVLYLADASRYVGAEAQAAARAFAEAAGPVVGLVGNALKAIGELAEWEAIVPVIPDVLPKLTALRDWLSMLVNYIASATLVAGEKAQAAARAFAEAAGPVVGIVGGGLKAIAELAAWETLADITVIAPALGNLRDFLGLLAQEIGKLATADVLLVSAAAKTFAENAGPVVTILTNSLKLLGDIAKLEMPSTLKVKGALSKVAELLTELIATFTELHADQGTLLGALQTFIANVDTTLTALGNALATLKEIGELQAPQIGLQWVYQLVNAMVQAIPSLEAVFTRIASIFTALQPDGRAAGLGFMRTLANGLLDGLDYVESALQAVADLFPASPAKAGPLRKVPDWQAWMLGGLDSAVGLVAAGLSSVNAFPGAALPGSALAPAPAPAEAAPITINFHNPVVREDNDLRRIVDAVSEALAQRTQTQTRLGLTW